MKRLTEIDSDALLGESRVLRLHSPIQVFGSTGKKAWSRPVNRSDIALIGRIAREPMPDAVPRVPIPWGDLYRSGYHEGISHLHHFYTRRNLIVFARLWQRTQAFPGTLGDALRFWLLSYNASHATIMSRVVAKTGQDELVTTSAQPGVLYVSGLPVEKNLFKGLRRKLKTIVQAFETIESRSGKVVVKQQSSCSVSLPDCSACETLRYQLLHRTASALYEAHRYHAKVAVMMVHSFDYYYLRCGLPRRGTGLETKENPPA
jgi:hypothetical protein